MAQMERETREFLEGLSSLELRRVLEVPVFRGTVLDAAAESERVSHTVDQILDEEFQAMNPDEQTRIDRLARSIAAKHL